MLTFILTMLLLLLLLFFKGSISHEFQFVPAVTLGNNGVDIMENYQDIFPKRKNIE